MLAKSSRNVAVTWRPAWPEKKQGSLQDSLNTESPTALSPIKDISSPPPKNSTELHNLLHHTPYEWEVFLNWQPWVTDRKYCFQDQCHSKTILPLPYPLSIVPSINYYAVQNLYSIKANKRIKDKKIAATFLIPLLYWVNQLDHYATHYKLFSYW